MVPDGTMLLGHARGQLVFLVRRGDELFAIGAICTHYGAPLEQGLLVGDTHAHGTMRASGCAPVRLSGRRRLKFCISIYEGARFSLLLVHAGRGKSGQQQAVTC
jgi:Rieske [2Fe-2S] domain